MENMGLVHIYCGDGKGKTTAAIGLSIRAAGRGKKVLIVQFLKSSETGELFILKEIPSIQVIRSEEQLGFTFRMNDQQKLHAAEVQQELFAKALDRIKSEEIGLLVLDEIMAAINSGMIKASQVAELIKNKPQQLELVMTGRNPPQQLVDLADYLSEIKKVKHPFDRGIPARISIEK